MSLSANSFSSFDPLRISFRTKEINIPYNPHCTVKTLKANVAVAIGMNPHRLRISYQPNEKERPLILQKELMTIQDYKIPAGACLKAKDLGPQIGYRTVFLVEYFGPLAIFILIFLFPTPIHHLYNPDYIHIGYNKTQFLALTLWVLHYTKRLYESVHVHSFSHATMPILNLFKNCFYYWGFATLIAYVISHKDYTAPHFLFSIIGSVIWLIGEWMNFKCHIHLSRLRRPDSPQQHPIPTDPAFKMVVCPNYTFEILAWLGFNIATFTLIGVGFMVAGAMQMHAWAVKKKKRYLSDHPDYPKKRPVLIPGLL